MKQSRSSDGKRRSAPSRSTRSGAQRANGSGRARTAPAQSRSAQEPRRTAPARQAPAPSPAPARAERSPLIRRRNKLFSGGGAIDLPFLALVLTLLVIGVTMMYSASYAYAYYSSFADGMYFFRQQLIYSIAGVAVMLAVSFINYRILHFWAPILMAVSVVLLIIVYFCPPVNNTHRWIPYPINFQPSEIAKFAVIALFAHLISQDQKKMKTFRRGFLPYITVLAVVCVLLVLEPHLSATILVAAIGGSMMIIGGTRLRYFGIALLIAVTAFVVCFYFPDILPFGIGDFIKSKLAHVYTRLAIWQDPFLDFKGTGWQTIQSLYAIASGGFLGVGLGNSRQKYLYISQPQNDFVFAVVCEELGFLGAAIIIILFALLIWRGFVIAMRASDRFGSLMVAGLTVQVGLQAFLNIAVVTNTIPNTGISLPFFSYGGSSMMMLLAQMGVILSVSRGSKLRKTT